MASTLRNVVVVGGSYVGTSAAKELANLLPATHRVVLIDAHSHFHHLFAFPRFAILPTHEHKAFIPYSGVFSASPDPTRHVVIQAKVLSLQSKSLTLDREWQGSKQVPFEYSVAATGTRLAAPGSMPHDEKLDSVAYLQAHQQGIKDAQSVIIIGGGAVGVQMACDLKEYYPEKDVTLVHSRDQLMPLYHEKLSDMIKNRFTELGVRLVTGSRVVLPEGGFDNSSKPVTVKLQNGETLSADFVIQATGQSPNTEFLEGLQPSSGSDALLNPQNGFIRVRPTLQFQDPAYPHFYAVGDIADTGAHKAARPGAGQAAVAAKNIVQMIEGKEPTEKIEVGPPGIHLSLGLTKNTIFRNPAKGETEPFVNLKDDGRADMGIDGVWGRRGVKVATPQDYHL